MTLTAAPGDATGSTGPGEGTPLPEPCGPLSRGVVQALRNPAGRPVLALGPESVLTDRDAELALWMLYELHYRGFAGVSPDAEREPRLLELRRVLERRLEVELRAAAAPRLVDVAGELDAGEAVLAVAAADDGPPLAAYLRRRATREQVCDYLRERSVQQLKESDPQAFLLPRLTGAAKVALAELLYDEFGAGHPERLHQQLYADALAAAGLDPTYPGYVDEVSAVSLAAANVMSLFALNRRWRGAAAGHFGAFEATSSVPSRQVAAGIERVGLPDEVAAYFHEHVEADAVHEQIAARDLCGALVAAEPDLRDDVLFGAACCLHLEALVGAELLGRWDA